MAARDVAVREFLGALTGIPRRRFLVLGEELQELVIPASAHWSASPVTLAAPDPHDEFAVRKVLAALGGHTGASLPWAELASRAAIIWILGDMLARRPMSITEMAERIVDTAPERQGSDPEQVRNEVELALIAGAALPDDVSGGLRLKTHRFVRGGWQFHRCVDPVCGKLHPMGEERCTCGKPTAPLNVCRNCGADALRFRSEPPDDPSQAALLPNGARDDTGEWVLYDRRRFVDTAADDDAILDLTRRQVRERPVLTGSLDPSTLAFSTEDRSYPFPVILAGARTRCLVCGGSAGSRPVLTPVSLGTSAAVRVLAEGLTEKLAAENKGRPGHDGKERLLIFADSRQDAAHQARFITYAGRYDRMRRRAVSILEKEGRPLTVAEVVHGLLVDGVEARDNPHASRFDDADYLPPDVQKRARAWEEAPLLDELALSAGYRATVVNLGLVGVRYQHLDKYVEKSGGPTAEQLGITELRHVCYCLLEEMRRRGALSREMLQYHPASPSCPDEFKEPADWERRIKQANGYACDDGGEPIANLSEHEVPEGLRSNGIWRRSGVGGRGPSLERKFRQLLRRFGGIEAPGEEQMLVH